MCLVFSMKCDQYAKQWESFFGRYATGKNDVASRDCYIKQYFKLKQTPQINREDGKKDQRKKRDTLEPHVK